MICGRAIWGVLSTIVWRSERLISPAPMDVGGGREPRLCVGAHLIPERHPTSIMAQSSPSRPSASSDQNAMCDGFRSMVRPWPPNSLSR